MEVCGPCLEGLLRFKPPHLTLPHKPLTSYDSPSSCRRAGPGFYQRDANHSWRAQSQTLLQAMPPALLVKGGAEAKATTCEVLQAMQNHSPQQ